MGAFSRGRARSSVLGIGSQVPGTRDGGGESGNKAECPSHASKTRTRGMLCQALHGYAMPSAVSQVAGPPGEVPESCPKRSRPGRYPPRWEGAVRMVETTFSHIQSTFSPRMWPHAVHVVDPRGLHGVQRRRVGGAGGPLCLRSEATRGSAGHGRQLAVVVRMRFHGADPVGGTG
jgi:hypothetical protein